MAEQDRIRWNERYAERGTDFAPAESLVSLVSLLRPTGQAVRALDLACGTGRNSFFLAELGYQVDAWDISDVGLKRLESELELRGAAGQSLSITTSRVDLDEASSDDQALVPPATYDLIVDYYFLDRGLFPIVTAALRPGGLLVFEAFFDAGPTREHRVDPAYLLTSGELPRAFAGLQVLEYVEESNSGVARLVARRPNA